MRNYKKRAFARSLGRALLAFDETGDKGKFKQRLRGVSLNFEADKRYSKLLKEVKKTWR